MPNTRGPNRPGPGRKPGAGRPSSARSGAPRPGGRSGASRRSTGRDRASAAKSRTGSSALGAGGKPGAGTTGPSQAQQKVQDRPVTRSEPQTGATARRKASLTTRAIALAVVLLILTISYASSLRVYVNQRQDIAATRAKIAASQENIDRLSDEIARWNDPAYVKTQARIRLGWVMPGETGYRVVGADGTPISGDTEIAAGQSAPKPKPAWYEKLWGSVETADDPTPAKSAPADEPAITTGSSKPSDDPTG